MAHVLPTVSAAVIGILASLLFLGPLKTESVGVAAAASLVSLGVGLYMPYHALRAERSGRIYMRGWVERGPSPLKFRTAIAMCYVWCALCFSSLASSVARLLG